MNETMWHLNPNHARRTRQRTEEMEDPWMWEGAVQRSKRRYLEVFSDYDQVQNSGYFKKKFMSYLFTSTLYNCWPDIPLVWINSVLVTLNTCYSIYIINL